MPKLTNRTLKDVKRYIPLRFDHMGDEWVKMRIRHVIRALKKEPIEVQNAYSDKVDAFFKLNEQVLLDAKANGESQLQPAIIDKALKMDTKEMVEFVYKCGGNVNLAMDMLSGDYDKQH